MTDKKKPFEKIRGWLKDKAPKVLDIVGDVLPDKGVLGIVKNLIDKDSDIPPEQKLEFEKLAVEYETLVLKDRESARNREIQVNQSEHASWLSKNTGSLIALAYTIFNFTIYALILLGWARTDNDISILIVNSITNIAMLIVGYYYGSSEKRNRLIESKS